MQVYQPTEYVCAGARLPLYNDELAKRPILTIRKMAAFKGKLQSRIRKWIFALHTGQTIFAFIQYSRVSVSPEKSTSQGSSVA